VALRSIGSCVGFREGLCFRVYIGFVKS
jgi:hypothetical protein